MKGRPAAGAPDRKERQRQRIIDAAEQCAIEKGLHAATMANIAATAKMSPGLIYRYFAGKNEIILAIIERQLQEMLSDLSRLGSGQELEKHIPELLISWKNRDASVMSPALFLEMSAQATRDPQIAKAVADADRIGGDKFREWLREFSCQKDRSEDSLEDSALILRCFIEGLALRSVREPDLAPERVASCLSFLLPMLMTGHER